MVAIPWHERCDKAPGPGSREKCPSGTGRWPRAEEEEVGHISRAECWEKTVSTGTKEKDGDAKEGRGHECKRRSPLGSGGDGERRRQEEAALPEDAELRDRELQPGRGETRQTRREDLVGEDGGRENAGAGHVLGRTWPEQCDKAPGPGSREKCPSGTGRWPRAEEEEVGHISRAECWEKTVSTGTKEKDGDAKEGRGHECKRRSPLGSGGDGERRRQEEAALPEDAELRDRELQPGRGETRQTRREDLVGEDGGRENAGAGHVLGRTWPEQHAFKCLKHVDRTLETQGPSLNCYDPSLRME
ncbi:hypothetical protein NDU88_000580 [Pleurodeles waltl]|uniref:Uncharacterized protein n=1 Tax=Pleurodeles waltl TaxID=8319 RepID=A0AAV7U517_PLEWA|nr:hypothetical protein NDU88_000580 [Pleurodeles waltl]